MGRTAREQSMEGKTLVCAYAYKWKQQKATPVVSTTQQEAQNTVSTDQAHSLTAPG